MSTTRHPVHRPVGRPAARRPRRQVRRLGLRRARAGLLGRPLRRRRGDARPGYAPAGASCSSATGSACWAIGNHLVGQAVCDPIDERHQGVLSPRGLGRRRSRGGARGAPPSAMKDTARAAAQLGVEVVTGFTGSPVWHLLYSFPPNDFDAIERGYEEFAERWGPIIDVFEAEGVRFALEVHPTEIAYDFVTTRKALEAIGDRAGLRHQLRPEPLRAPVPRLGRVHHRVRRRRSSTPTSRTRVRHLDGRSLDPRRPPRLRRARARLGLRLAGPRRRRLRGDDPRAQPHRLRRPALDRVGGLRAWTATGARPTRSPSCARTDFAPSAVAFDAAFAKEA